MKTLIVPTDFSAVSLNATNYAAEMAMAIGGSMVLLHVYTVPVIYSETPVLPVTTLSVDELRKSSEEKLEELKRNLQHVTSGKVKIYTENRFGNVVDELETLCGAVQPFAVVMGSHGASGLERLLMGSNTLTAIRRIKYPVIVVPPGTTYRGIRKIGLACDFKDVVETTPVAFIKSMVQEFGAELHILNIDRNKKQHNDEAVVESAWIETMLGDVKPNYYFLDREEVVEGINEFAETSNLDVVMVIPKKHNLVENIFHKSKSKELVTHSHIPIVSIHE